MNVAELCETTVGNTTGSPPCFGGGGYVTRAGPTDEARAGRHFEGACSSMPACVMSSATFLSRSPMRVPIASSVRVKEKSATGQHEAATTFRVFGH